MKSTASARRELGPWVGRSYAVVEDVVYIGLGLLLAGIVVALLLKAFVAFARSVVDGSLPNNIIGLLAQLLLILLLVELLDTVRVSFRAHTLSPEPFLLIGLISAIRRMLVLHAQMSESHDKNAIVPTSSILELAVLAALILALAASIVLLKRTESKGGANA